MLTGDQSAVQNQPGGAADAGVIAEAGEHQPGLLGGRKGVAPESLRRPVDDDLPSGGNAAAEDEHLGIAHAGDAGQSPTQIVGEKVHHLQGQRVPGLGAVKDILGRQRIGLAHQGGGIRGGQPPPGLPNHPGGRGVLLQAALFAAAAGHSLGGIDLDVADLAAGAVDAGQQFTVHNDATAHAGAQGDKHHIGIALAAAQPHLTQGGCIGVVDHLDRAAAQGTQRPGGVAAPALEIDAGLDKAILQHCAGDAQANARHLGDGNPAFLLLRLQSGGNVGQNLRSGVGGAGGNLPLVQQFALQSEQAQLDGGTAQVNTEYILLHGSVLEFDYGVGLGGADGSFHQPQHSQGLLAGDELGGGAVDGLHQIHIQLVVVKLLSGQGQGLGGVVAPGGHGLGQAGACQNGYGILVLPGVEPDHLSLTVPVVNNGGAVGAADIPERQVGEVAGAHLHNRSQAALKGQVHLEAIVHLVIGDVGQAAEHILHLLRHHDQQPVQQIAFPLVPAKPHTDRQKLAYAFFGHFHQSSSRFLP